MIKEGLQHIVVFTGVPGSGKGHHLQLLEARNAAPEGVKITSMGSELLVVARKRLERPDLTRDDLKYLTQLQMDENYDLVIESVLNQTPSLLDSHVVTQREGTILASQEHLHLRLRPERYMHLLADPKVIAEQREMDKTRKRVVESVSDIDRHQVASYETTRRIVKELGAQMIEIWNSHSQDQLEGNIEVIRGELEELKRRSS